MEYRTKFATEGTYAPDRLVAGNAHLLVGKHITLLSGQNLQRGAVLGVALGAATAAAAGAGSEGANTGTGTLTMDATTPLLANAQAGVYTVRAIDVTGTHAGTFRVTDPHGNVLGDVALPATENGTATFANQIKFEIADAATDFIITDGFTVTVSAGTKAQLSLAAAVDGSQTPVMVLAEDTDASAGDTPTLAYVRGDLNPRALIYGTGHNADTVAEPLRARGITLLPTVAA